MTTAAVDQRLAAACDALVLSALQAVGRRVLKAQRSRMQNFSTTPLHQVHCGWAITDADVAPVLARAWDAVPTLVASYCPSSDPAKVAAALDGYTRSLVRSRKAHSPAVLAEVMTRALGH